jgi:lysozyme family protein
MIGVTADGIIGTRTLAALLHADVDDILPQIDPDNLALLHTRLGLPPSSGIGLEVKRALSRQNAMDTLLVLVLSGLQTRDYRIKAGFRRWGKGWLSRTKRRTDTALALVSAAAKRPSEPSIF